MRIPRAPAIALLAAALACNAQAAAPSIAPTPSIPSYGQELQVQLLNINWPVFLPSMRYWISGTVINVDYEFASDGFSPAPPNFGDEPLSFGELAAANYTVQAHLHDLGNPSAPVQVITTNIPVLPPSAWGIYAVPGSPNAFAPWRALVRSAVYYDPSTLRASVSGGVIRVDFDYYGDKPTGGPAPAGSTSYGSIEVAGLAPGAYRVEGWGRAKSGGAPALYFTRDIAVNTVSPVVEFYNESLDHYFMSAVPSEITGLDNDSSHAYKRTGQRWSAWVRASDAPPAARAVCRFFAAGPRSHFYTADPAECQFLRSLEAQQRAEAAAANRAFQGWGYEGIAFYALVPVNGVCAGDTEPVYRAFNKGQMRNDSNHRFMPDSRQRAAMVVTWADEGVAFCSPNGAGR